MQSESYVNILLALLLVFIGLVCWIIYHATDVPHIELFYNESSNLIQKILASCPCLHDKYIPTYIWGKSGHVQSLAHTKIGRFGGIFNYPSKRYQLNADDGSIISYDIFEPTTDVSNSAISENLILIVPGICNHAENDYVKAFTYHMASRGFRLAVYNHTGALKSVELKQPRLFTYGHTSDLEAVIERILTTEKVNKFIGIGFSLGGNILLKYLGEKSERQNHFHFATSICAGYDVPECNRFFQDWENLRCLYNYALTRNMLKIIRHHKYALSRFCQSREPPLDLNWNKILSSKKLHELDTEFTLKINNESDIDKFYRVNSSSRFLDKIHIPMLLINAKDDPLIPTKHYKYPKKLLEHNKNALFVVTPFGGHLGFFEGGYLIPNKLTWLDRTLTEFFTIMLKIIKEDNAEDKQSVLEEQSKSAGNINGGIRPKIFKICEQGEE